MNKLSSKNLKQIFTIPNILSFFRIIIIFPFVHFFINQNYVVACILILLSGLSDMFDGMIARKFNQITDLGKLLDPVADKLTLIALSICTAYLYKPIVFLVGILMIKEIIIIVGGIILISNKIPVPPAKWYGKLATIIFYVCSISLISLKALWNFDSFYLTSALFILILIAMLFSLVKYTLLFIDLLKNNKESKKIKQED